MPLRRRKGSSYWQIQFKLAGREVRQSSGVRDRKTAEELEQELRSNLWREIHLGEKRYTWNNAIEKYRAEDSHQRSWERTERSITVLNEYLSGSLLTEIDYDALLKIRTLLTCRTGYGWHNKTGRRWKKSTVNRVMAVARVVLRRCVDPWKMLQSCPRVPLYKLDKTTPKWITREQARTLFEKFPRHTRDMMLFALATGLRRTNVTHLEWNRVDMDRATAYIPGDAAKGKTSIPVPLNADALAVLARWAGKHDRYVFCFRSRAPIKQVATRMWRRVCKEASLEGVTFHTMRHSWASWHIQAETPIKLLQELGGWATLEMPLRYAHLSPGHLANYADRTLIGIEARGSTKSDTVEGSPINTTSRNISA
jgi:integrase